MSRFLPLIAIVFALSTISPAFARPPYSAQFVESYAKDEKNKDFNKLVVETAKCNVCHIGTVKKDRNEYGVELAKILKWSNFGTPPGSMFNSEKAEEKQKAKDMVIAALKKVEEMKAKDGETFIAKIKAGKLPGGDPKQTLPPAPTAPPKP